MIGQFIRRELDKVKMVVVASAQADGADCTTIRLACQRQDPDASNDGKAASSLLKSLCQTHEAKVYFADEAGIRSDCHAGTTWAERDSTPVVKATGARFSCNMISAVSPLGELRFMLTRE